MSGTGVRPSLTQRAFDELRSGPLATPELARRVLGLEGHPGAVSAAVFTLLGPDERFEVDALGFWRLAAGAEPPGAPFDRVSFAVVDLETTGGPYSAGHRITEVGIVFVDRGLITGEYHTLVNPGRTIPPLIARITGIHDDMVAAAPYFGEVADQVFDALDGRVFVAHNVGFDWNFLRGQLAELTGDVPAVRRLCTVRMARRLLPRVRRRNLDALADHFEIPIFDRHRAYGDARATARVLIRLLERASAEGLRDLDALERFVNRPGRRRKRPVRR